MKTWNQVNYAEKKKKNTKNIVSDDCMSEII